MILTCTTLNSRSLLSPCASELSISFSLRRPILLELPASWRVWISAHASTSFQLQMYHNQKNKIRYITIRICISSYLINSHNNIQSNQTYLFPHIIYSWSRNFFNASGRSKSCWASSSNSVTSSTRRVSIRSNLRCSAVLSDRMAAVFDLSHTLRFA